MFSRDILRPLDTTAPPHSGEARRRAQRRRQIGAGAGSVAFHVLLFFLAFATLKGAAVSGGAGSDAGIPDAIMISLAGVHGGAKASAPPSQTELDALFKRILRDQQPSPITASPDKPKAEANLDKLFDVIDKQRQTSDPAPATTDGRQGDSQTDHGGTGSSADGAKTQTPTKQGKADTAKPASGPGSAASTGSGLWGQIAPCWGRLPQVSTVPVTLEITLNAKGQIATPPKIIRQNTNGAPDERRLIAEARALAAVTACVPYHGEGSAGSAGVFRVEFAKGR